ncbi:hypothetical protein MB901379_02959 [Mycobacterium basiliense]|uniref:Uncharacterized protein n=1 Tax=Mycobacterium basiliense TaxID=2094119 RepID=A0A447GFY8_9MYCO|nr:hypothetical protein MB901379_02959 [Mycobacterium basiliense]
MPATASRRFADPLDSVNQGLDRVLTMPAGQAVPIKPSQT